MDSQKTDLVIQYALAVASEADDFRDRELGPIHLLKFVYLADLAYARAERQSFTGAHWKFHKFGPWAVEVYQRIPAATSSIGAFERKFAATSGEEGVRWRVKDTCLAKDLEPELPWSVAREVKHAVRQFGADTTGLLHFVYQTSPMLKVAPGDALDLLAEEIEEASPEAGSFAEARLPELSKSRVKKLQALVKDRLEERRQVKKLVIPAPAPRFDELFTKGQDWLDGMAGEPVTAEKGQIHFSDEVWKSPGRRDPEIP